MLSAMGIGGEATGTRGALITILNQPFGRVLLSLTIVGLLGYSAWRIIQSLKDPDQHGKGAKGLAIRISLLISAIVHLSLAYWASTLLIGGEIGGSTNQQQEGWLSSGFGQLALLIIGLFVVGTGFAHIYKGFRIRYERYMTMPSSHLKLMRVICSFGLIARGAVWLIVGWFFINSARTARSKDIQGMSDALQALEGASYANWLYAVVAAGLFAFGIYSLCEAAFRRIQV